MIRTRHLAWLLTLLAGSASAQTTIDIVNNSFENDPITGANAPVFMVAGAPSGWMTHPNYPGARGLLAPNAVADDKFYPGATSGFHGDKVEFHWEGHSEIHQTLAETLRANTRYTLSLDSGTRASGGGAFGGYQIRLETETGKPVGHWIAVKNNLAPAGQFATISRTFQTGAAPAGLGEHLRIAMRLGTTKGYADLDNVHLVRVDATPIVAETPIDVVIVAGQSNAMGWGSDAAKLSAENRHYADAPNPHALLGYHYQGLGDPVASVGSMGLLDTQGSGFPGHFDGFGPELSMGTDLTVGIGNKPTAIIKFTVGGAGLNQNFRKVGATSTPYYSPMMTHIKTMLSQLRAMGYAPRLRAFFWLQGETDALYGTSHLYEANIIQFMADIRNDTASPWLQFYLTELNPNMPDLADKPGMLAVNAAMHAARQTNPCDIQVIPTDDISGNFADTIHYSANQSITIGQRWAAAFLARNH